MRIPSCYLAVYTDESRDTARLLLGYDRDQPIRKVAEPVTFPSVEVIPRSLLPADRPTVYTVLPLTFEGLDSYRGYELTVNGKPLNQAIHGNDFWQTDYDPATRKWSQTFNLPRNGSEPIRIEFSPRRP